MSLDVDTARDMVTRGPEQLLAGQVILDRPGRRVIVRGVAQQLPKREFELLEMLMIHRGRALSREVLFDCLWGGIPLHDNKTLDVHILRLRRRIEPSPHETQYIHTLRGFGYLFEPPA